MLTLEDYARIRLAYRDGMSIRAIAREFGHSWRKVREVIDHPEPKAYTREKAPVAPKLGPFIPIIDEILTADEKAPRKQRHTAAQIFRRLCKEDGYSGGYDQVRRYVRKHRTCDRETFIPLDHDPGQRAEADFGQIYVDFPEGRRPVAVLIVTWAHSYRPFAIALPTQRVEAILHGMAEAFKFFGCVPREVWWDNPKTVAVSILVGRERKLHDRYLALVSHYNFQPLFCMPARGNEKPYVENRVKNLQRRWVTPVPRMRDLDELNTYLRQCCLEDLTRVATGQSETIGQRFQQDHAQALTLPERIFDACITEPRKVDKYQTVAFDNNRYSVPRPYAFKNVIAKGYVDRIEIVAEAHTIARHPRSYRSGEQILDPLHYLAVLGRKPAYLDHTAVFDNWKLPAIFTRLRDQLERRHGCRAGSRQFIRVLQLLGHHPLERVRKAVELCQGCERLQADVIIARTELLARRAADCLDCHSHCVEVSLDAKTVPEVRVPLPNLKHFDQFLSPGDFQDESITNSFHAVESEPKAAAAANDACRI